MSVLENGLENVGKLGRQLFDLNNETMVKFVDLSADNFKKYLELNQTYVAKLPEVNDVSSFVELQREYGQNLWEGMQADLRARGEIVREVVEQTGALVRGTVEETASEVKAAEAA
jgi:GTP-dependent phosphoenolpyruvate carboxykinase